MACAACKCCRTLVRTPLPAPWGSMRPARRARLQHGPCTCARAGAAYGGRGRESTQLLAVPSAPTSLPPCCCCCLQVLRMEAEAESTQLLVAGDNKLEDKFAQLESGSGVHCICLPNICIGAMEAMPGIMCN